MSNDAAIVRALLIAHLPTRNVPSFLAGLAKDGFTLAESENPAHVHWPSSAWQHSHLMCWMHGPRGKIQQWGSAQGVMGFTEDDGLAWTEDAAAG